MEDSTNPFSGLKYYIIKCNDQDVISQLNSVGASANPFLSESLKFAISDEQDNLENGEAEDIYAVPVVTSKWVSDSFFVSKLLPMQFYHPCYQPLFKDLVFVFTELSLNDRINLTGIVKASGGTVNCDLSHETTHLVLGLPQGPMYEYLKENNKLDTKVIVTPDWIYESINKKSLVSHEDFNPALLVLPKPKPIKKLEPLPVPKALQCPSEPRNNSDLLPINPVENNKIISSSDSQPNQNQQNNQPVSLPKPNFNMTMGTNLAAAASTSVQQILSQGNQMMNQPLTNLNAAQMGPKFSFNSPKKNNSYTANDLMPNYGSASTTRTPKSSKSKSSRHPQEQNLNEEEKDAIVMRNVMNILSQQHNWKKDSESGSRGGNSSDSFTSQNGGNNGTGQNLNASNCASGSQKKSKSTGQKSTARSSSGQSSSNTTPQKSPKIRQPQNFPYSSPQQSQKMNMMFRPGMKNQPGNYPPLNSGIMNQQNPNQMMTQQNHQNLPRQPSFTNIPPETRNQMVNIEQQQNIANPSFLPPNQVPNRNVMPTQTGSLPNQIHHTRFPQNPLPNVQNSNQPNMNKLYSINENTGPIMTSASEMITQPPNSLISNSHQNQFSVPDQNRCKISENQNIEFPQSMDINQSSTPSKASQMMTSNSGNVPSPMAKSPHPSQVSPICGPNQNQCQPYPNQMTSPSPQKNLNEKQNLPHQKHPSQIMNIQNNAHHMSNQQSNPYAFAPSTPHPNSTRYDDGMNPQHPPNQSNIDYVASSQQQKMHAQIMHQQMSNIPQNIQPQPANNNLQMNYQQMSNQNQAMRPPSVSNNAFMTNVPQNQGNMVQGYPNHPGMIQNQYIQQKIQRFPRPMGGVINNPGQMQPPPHQSPHMQQQQQQQHQNFSNQMMIQQQMQNRNVSPQSQMRLPMGIPLNRSQIRYGGPSNQSPTEQQMKKIHQDFSKTSNANMNPQLQTLLMNKQPQAIPQQQLHPHQNQMLQQHHQQLQPKFGQQMPSQMTQQNQKSFPQPNLSTPQNPMKDSVEMNALNQPFQTNQLSTPQQNIRPHLNHTALISIPRYYTIVGSPVLEKEDECLFGCVIFLAGYDDVEPSTKSKWRDVMRSKGADVIPYYDSQKVTHLVIDWQLYDPDLFKQALKDEKRIVTIHWINHVISMKKQTIPDEILHLPSPFSPTCTFSFIRSQIITSTGFHGKEKLKVEHIVKSIGAKYTDYMDESNTILICKGPIGKKYEAAQNWGIPCVNVRWLQDLYLGDVSALSIDIARHYLSFESADVNLSLYLKTTRVLDLLIGWKTPITMTQELYNHHCELKNKIERNNDEEDKKENLETDSQPSCLESLTKEEINMLVTCRLRSERLEKDKGEQKEFYLRKEKELQNELNISNNQASDTSSELAVVSADQPKETENAGKVLLKEEVKSEPMESDQESTKIDPIQEPMIMDDSSHDLSTNRKRHVDEVNPDEPVNKMVTEEKTIEVKEEIVSTIKEIEDHDKESEPPQMKDVPLIENVNKETAESLARSPFSDTQDSIKIAMTGLSLKQRKELTKIINSIPNSEVVEDMKIATHLVAEKIIRVPKIYIAVAQGKFICSYKWILASKMRGEWLDENDWILSDPEGESKMNFKLKEALNKSRRRLIECNPLLFKGIEFWVSKGIRNREICTELIKICGGVLRDKKPMKKMVLTTPPKQLFICHEDEYASAVHLLKTKAGCRGVHHEEFILSNVLQQKLDFDSYQIRHVASIQEELLAVLDSVTNSVASNNNHLVSQTLNKMVVPPPQSSLVPQPPQQSLHPPSQNHPQHHQQVQNNFQQRPQILIQSPNQGQSAMVMAKSGDLLSIKHGQHIQQAPGHYQSNTVPQQHNSTHQVLFHHQQQQQIKYHQAQQQRIQTPNHQHSFNPHQNNPRMFQPNQQQNLSLRPPQPQSHPHMNSTANFSNNQQQQFSSIQPHTDQSQNFVHNPGNNSFLVFSNSMPIASSGQRQQFYQSKPNQMSQDNLQAMINGSPIKPNPGQPQQMSNNNPHQQQFRTQQQFQSSHQIQNSQNHVNIMPRNQLICNPSNQMPNQQKQAPLQSQQQQLAQQQQQHLQQVSLKNQNMIMSSNPNQSLPNYNYNMMNDTSPQNIRLSNPRFNNPALHQQPTSQQSVINNPPMSQVVHHRLPIPSIVQTAPQLITSQSNEPRKSSPIQLANNNLTSSSSPMCHKPTAETEVQIIGNQKNPNNESSAPASSPFQENINSPKVNTTNTLDNLLTESNDDFNPPIVISKPQENSDLVVNIAENSVNINDDNTKADPPEIISQTATKEDTQSTIAFNKTIDDSMGPPESLPTESMIDSHNNTNILNNENITD